MNQNHFVGYAQLADLLDKASTVFPLYFIMVRHNSPETIFASGTYTYRLEVAQLRQEVLHYWHKEVALANYMSGEIMSAHKDRPKTALSAEAAIKKYLAERGFAYVAASVAIPKDVTVFYGRCQRLGFRKKKLRFFLKPKPKAKP